jgi:hypothetical protein
MKKSEIGIESELSDPIEITISEKHSEQRQLLLQKLSWVVRVSNKQIKMGTETKGLDTIELSQAKL